ncbi:MAG: hypothetical protein H7Y10_10010 [Flavobacterium sp.]|nr:hypothetical protein [Flavobacterium sp.]
MKTIVNRFFILIITLLGVMDTFAAPSPPMPGAKAKPPPPGLSIDDNLVVLLLMAIFLGIYIICKHQVKTKASI